MIRVLHVFHNMGNGGVENFVMNYYRFIDREKVQFDFLTSVEEDGYFDDEIVELGGKVYHAYPKKKNLLRNFFSIAKIVKDNNYSIIHRHTGSCVSNIDLLAAKAGGASILISHAHSTQAGKKILHYIAKVFLNIKCKKYACSESAGEWLFGKNAIEKEEVQWIYNAVDVETFLFNKTKRDEYRKINQDEDSFVIGHVGNFNIAKNHSFIIDVFAEVRQKRNNAVLWLIGNGILQNEIKEKVDTLGLSSCVKFMGNRNDVSNLMNAMDIFLFPSVYEGFPVTLIEAQTSGLPCFVSKDVIPKEVDVSGQMSFLSLKSPANIWAQEILKVDVSKRDIYGYMRVKEKGFDIRDAAKQLEERYVSYVKS